MPWHTTQPALALLASLREKPPVQRHKTLCGRTVDRWATFTGAAYDGLSAICEAEFAALDVQTPWPKDAIEALVGVTPEDVLGSLFGDPNGGPEFQTHRDLSERWEAIRREIAAALQGTGEGERRAA